MTMRMTSLCAAVGLAKSQQLAMRVQYAVQAMQSGDFTVIPLSEAQRLGYTTATLTWDTTQPPPAICVGGANLSVAPAPSAPFFRVDNPVVWVGGIALVGGLGFLAYRFMR